MSYPIKAKRGNTDDVVRYFILGFPAKSSGSFYSDGIVAYSYNTPIALKLSNSLYLNKNKYSMTTSIQQNKIRKMAVEANMNIMEVSEDELRQKMNERYSEKRSVPAEEKKSGFTMDDVKRINAEKGFHFFSPDTMRFFKSKIESQLYADKYFITSEKKGFEDSTRGYSVREFNKDTGDIETIGEFGGYTKPSAKLKIQSLIMVEQHNGF
jgi:hypothetical protein